MSVTIVVCVLVYSDFLKILPLILQQFVLGYTHYRLEVDGSLGGELESGKLFPYAEWLVWFNLVRLASNLKVYFGRRFLCDVVDLEFPKPITFRE
ncbi:hypothetical protein Tco_0188778 [Tanacetum coccineum]